MAYTVTVIFILFATVMLIFHNMMVATFQVIKPGLSSGTCGRCITARRGDAAKRLGGHTTDWGRQGRLRSVLLRFRAAACSVSVHLCCIVADIFAIIAFVFHAHYPSPAQGLDETPIFFGNNWRIYLPNTTNFICAFSKNLLMSCLKISKP